VNRISLLVFLALFLAGCSFAMAQQPAATPAQPAQTGRHIPEAKTHQEFTDYNAAYARSGGLEVERAADEFERKYPSSELKAYLYAKALHEYQNEQNTGKMLSVGRKIIQIDPDNTIALVLTATVLADALRTEDSDRQQKVDEIKKDSAHALDTVDSDFTPPANATPEQITAYKKTLQSMAHSALGITALKTNDDLAAERELKLAAELNVTQPDPYIWYHLALAQDHQKKYSEALDSINHALQVIGANADLGNLARGEQGRLLTLTRGASASPEKAPAQPPK
jgi:tetratricopeptide (TPR) repeat protein